MNVPAQITADSARLPATYENAKQALATCEQIDECQDWADKAAALASYAKQAEDDALERYATRIRARAIRRAGELLKQFHSPGARTDQPGAAADTRLTQRQAASEAGMSKRQQVTAVRVASIPTEQFEEAVESPRPPTITDLADIGQKTRAAVVPDKPRQPMSGQRLPVPDGMTAMDWAKQIATADVSETATAAQTAGVGLATYRMLRDLVLLDARADLPPRSRALVDRAVALLDETGHARPSHEMLADLIAQAWGNGRRGGVSREIAEHNNLDAFWRAYGVVIQSCMAAADINVPLLPAEKVKEIDAEMGDAISSLRAFRKRFMEMHQ